MRTLEDYQALGRLQGAQDAHLGMSMCLGKDAAYREAWNDARLVILGQKAEALIADGATEVQAIAYASEAARRFEEACVEIRLAVEMECDAVRAPQPESSSPAANRKARRARKAKGVH